MAIDELDTLGERFDLLVPAGAAVDGAARACRRRRPPGSSTSATWMASSRVGTSTRPSGRARLGLVGDAGEHRHAERERLAGTGLGPAAHVATLHRDRDRLGLDRERLGEPGGGEADVDAFGHAEVGETRSAPRPEAAG